jgi:hypothetical protein
MDKSLFRMRDWWIDEAHRDFKKDLKKLDENLLVFRDKIEHDWVIVRKDQYGRHHEIAHYEHLDNRVFKSLDDGDLRKRTPKQWEEYIDNHNNKIKSDQAKEVHESNMEFGRRVYVDAGIREHKTQF